MQLPFHILFLDLSNSPFFLNLRLHPSKLTFSSKFIHFFINSIRGFSCQTITRIFNFEDRTWLTPTRFPTGGQLLSLHEYWGIKDFKLYFRYGFTVYSQNCDRTVTVWDGFELRRDRNFFNISENFCTGKIPGKRHSPESL